MQLHWEKEWRIVKYYCIRDIKYGFNMLSLSMQVLNARKCNGTWIDIYRYGWVSTMQRLITLRNKCGLCRNPNGNRRILPYHKSISQQARSFRGWPVCAGRRRFSRAISRSCQQWSCSGSRVIACWMSRIRENEHTECR